MKVRLNPDEEVVKRVREGLKRTGGYCPCRLQRTEDNKCHCMLYYKEKEPQEPEKEKQNRNGD